ncbi:MAG: alpha/beta family hydrolase [Pseudidiomarina maritima]|uniref:Alpha/beta hydrolase n=1 Tax=Pseudidiomarina fusca TaxID=2965078 RepID=A0ABU3KUU1_9GAMM|nr:alpha/beta fold hydrolase [Pseudidiomarina sp. GXY010]MDT7524772.1 alpha/beta hydrolase [Pseudidiomarina sp. GXY010]MDX1525244.1 alpha/beta family hydrolase [Pseudidiomarina maritima]
MNKAQRVAVQRDNPHGHTRIVFAHGAGAGLQSDFMQFMALGLALQGFDVVRFNFPYWQQFMESGRRRPPNPMAVLEHTMTTVIEQFDDAKPLLVMGKSMGARVAFRIADQVAAKHAVALGFPFHPVGKPDQLRVTDLANHCASNLIVQGTRDSFGKPDEVAGYSLPDNVQMRWIDGGDHSFEATKRSGLVREHMWQQAIDAIIESI